MAAYEVCGWPLPDVWDQGLNLPEFNNSRTALKLISEGDETAALERIKAHKTVATPRALLEIAAEGKIPKPSADEKWAAGQRQARELAEREAERRRAEIAEAERAAATADEVQQHIAAARARLEQKAFAGGSVR